MNDNPSAQYCNFLVGQNSIRWRVNFQSDPVLEPIGDTLVAFALGIEEEDLKSYIQSGLLSRTCTVEIYGEQKKYYCNYWDVLQASACFSLIAIGLYHMSASDFAENLCDLLASMSEDSQSFDDFHLDNLISIVNKEITDYLPNLNLQIAKYGRDSIAAKVAIDLTNTSTRLSTGFQLSASKKNSERIHCMNFDLPRDLSSICD